MNEILNFKDSWILVQQNWIWLGLAFALGVWVGYKYSTPDNAVH